MNSVRDHYPTLVMPVDVRLLSYRATSLLDPTLSLLARHNITNGYTEDQLLLTGVRGTARLLRERTHGLRFSTFAMSAAFMREQGSHLEQEDDPFWYADTESDKAPALVIYDRQKLEPLSIGHTDASRRFEDHFGRVSDPNVYGVAEGNLDDATLAAVLLKPTNLHR